VAKKKRAEPKPDPEPLRVAAADALEKYLTPEETADLGLRGTEATVESGLMRVSDLIRTLRNTAREEHRRAAKLKVLADKITDMKAKYSAFQREQRQKEAAKLREAKAKKARLAKERKAAARERKQEERKLLKQIRRDRKTTLLM
jgi:hypothetical protein